MHTKIIHWWSQLILWLSKKTCQKTKIYCVTPLSLNRAEKNEFKTWKVYKLTNVPFFAALFKEFPMGCKDALLTVPHLKNPFVNVQQLRRIPNNHKTRKYVFSVLERCICMDMRDSRKKVTIFSIFSQQKIGATDPANSWGVCVEDIETVEHIVQAGFFLYRIEFVDGSMINQLARRSAGKH